MKQQNQSEIIVIYVFSVAFLLEFLRNSILIVKPNKAIFHTDIFRLFLVSY